MKELQELKIRLKDLDDKLVTCMRCGMCQAVCPVFGQTGNESDVARGKLALLDGIASEMLTDAEGVNEKLNRCLMCGTCEANCPSGVKITEIFLDARIILTEYLGLPWPKKVIFRGMLAKPRLFDRLMSLGITFQGFFTRKTDPLLATSCARINLSILEDRHFNTLAKVPLHKSVPRLDSPPGASGLRVGFFVGCVIDKIFPNVGMSALEILENNGVGVFLPPGQACCGIPALTSGDRITFNQLTAMNLKGFKEGKFDYMVTTCASCTSTIKELWPSQFQGDPELQQLARELADKTMDISQFLVDVVGIESIETSVEKAVTYHDPCHLCNSLHVTAQPRAMISAAGCSFCEMDNAASCCGSGGSFNVLHYGISKKIGNVKAESIVASGAKIVATSCPACMMQLGDLLSHRKKGIAVRHVIEIYAEALRQKNSSQKEV